MAKRIIVTGGNKGIGKEICRQLTQLGHQTVLTARNKVRGQKAAKELGVTFMPLDVSDDVSVTNFASACQKRFSSIDVLINNAGIYEDSRGLTTVDIDSFRETFEINFYGPMRVARALLSLLCKSDDGRIINISSSMGAFDHLAGNYAAYSLSKSGLNAQSLLLSRELESEGIKVNAVCPGWVRTDMGGQNARLSVEEGAETAVWLATAENIPNGKFVKDKKVIDW